LRGFAGSRVLRAPQTGAVTARTAKRPGAHGAGKSAKRFCRLQVVWPRFARLCRQLCPARAADGRGHGAYRRQKCAQNTMNVYVSRFIIFSNSEFPAGLSTGLKIDITPYKIKHL
jgi:hypothetical protein